MDYKIIEYNKYKKEIDSLRYEIFIEELGFPISLLSEDVTDKDAVHIAVFCKGKLIGASRLVDEKIERVVIKKEFRHKGIGEILVKHCLKVAKEMAIKKVSLIAVLKSYDFYIRLGFKEICKKEVYGKEHMLVEKNIE